VGKEDAAGANAHAEGNATLATGRNAHSEGKKTFAQGDNSHSEGQNSVSSGRASHTEGYSTQVYAKGFKIVGFNEAAKSYTLSNVTGLHAGQRVMVYFNDVEDSGIAKIVKISGKEVTVNITPPITYGEDWFKNNSGYFRVIDSPSIGDTILAHYAHAEGESTEALGIASHAEGYYTKAVSDTSHAEGHKTTA
jgi:hypothetical protein